MDSKGLYVDACRGSIFGKSRVEKLRSLERIVNSILSETEVNNMNIYRSSFVNMAYDYLSHSVMSTADYYLYDIYVIIDAVYRKVVDPLFVIAKFEGYDQYMPVLFEKKSLNNMAIEADTVNKIRLIQSVLDEKKLNINQSNRNFVNMNQGSYVTTINDERRNIASNEMNVEKASQSDNAQNQKNEILKICNEKMLERSNNCKENVRRWHNESSLIQESMKNVQASVSETLNKVMNLSDEITERYVLQFAQMQIDLYNLIADNYEYHSKLADEGNNNNYYNAVMNYQEFMEMIVDSLSAFGVEEIKSSVGSMFDGNVHEPSESAYFSSRNSSVKESIRSGFKYKDIVIQKEKIRI